MLGSFKDFEEMLSGGKPGRLAVAAAHDAHTMEAVMLAERRGLITPILIGDAAEIRRLRAGRGPDTAEVIDLPDGEAAARKAAELARSGNADCIMKGMLETGVFMRAMVNRETGIRKRDTMSLVAFMDAPAYHKVFAVTDVGLLTYPTLEQKKAEILNAAEAFHALGVENPKVAVLASVEKYNPKMPETADAVQLKEWNMSGELAGCVVEGPISFDLATDPSAAAVKGYSSPVAGDADILLVPDITSGNILAKCLTGMAGAVTCGIVMGARVPLVLTSRSAAVEDKYMAIVLSALAGSRGL